MKISEETWGFLVCVVIGCLFGSLFFGGLWTSKQQLDWFENETLELKSEFSETYLLKEGIVESPSVIILLENKTDFVSKLQELDATTIYYEETGTRISFYVFGYEDGMFVVYRFTVSAW